MHTQNHPNDLIETCQGTFKLFKATAPEEWIKLAQEKGFELTARIEDRYHLALRCQTCGAINKVKAFTLRTAQPQCQACTHGKWKLKAATVGATYLGRDPQDRHYAIYRLTCGHEVRRQFELMERAAKGEIDVRCDTCHGTKEAEEAQAYGWTLISPDPKGDANYRLYAHDACGHEQRIARANMQSGRFSCGKCGEDWPAAPSYLYAMHFTLPNGQRLVKLGFSRNPESRMNYQLRRSPDVECTLLMKVPMSSGQAALRLEKAMHKEIRAKNPQSIVPCHVWKGHLRVKTEVYDDAVTSAVLKMLKGIV